jgi:hypothetical protein
LRIGGLWEFDREGDLLAIRRPGELIGVGRRGRHQQPLLGPVGVDDVDPRVVAVAAAGERDPSSSGDQAGSLSEPVSLVSLRPPLPSAFMT